VQRGPGLPVNKLEIDRIAAETRARVERERNCCLDLVRRCDAVIEMAAELPLINQDQLRQQRHDLQVRADAITRHLHRWRGSQFIALLHAGERAGVDLGYTTGKGMPYGPGIDYLVQAAAAIGLPVSASSARRIIKTYNKLLRAVFGGSGSLSADAEVRSPPLWFWDIDR
jgi:hypothetical protein